jgi:hypothetical protein
VLNFYRFLNTYDKKATQVLSANLGGPSERYLKILNASERDSCILCNGKDTTTTDLGKRIDAAIKRRSNNEGNRVTFAISIDATKVAKVLEVSSGFQAIIGGEYPKHFIDIKGKSKEQVTKVLDGTDDIMCKIAEATEIKVALLTFQSSPPGVPISELVAARPQSNNESNDFIKEIELEASASVSRHKQARFSNISVDGVSCESKHVWRMICTFLSCLANHTGATDTNHNQKSWRYQIIAGGGTVGATVGKYMVDAFLLRIAGVAMDLWRPNDFAADLPVLKLASFATIQKLSQSNSPDFGSTSEGDKGVLALTLFFVRLHLHAVNGTSVPAKHRVIYLWCSMVWLTSISGASMITKRNIVAETISFAFIMMSSDVSKPRYCTSEPVEHTFGQLRTMIREFTTLEFAQLYEKLIRRLEKMYKFGFNPSRDPNKGYSSTFRNYFKYSVATKQPLMEGTVQLLMNGDFVAKQLWSAVNELINYSSTLMTPFLSALGVTNDNCSPFSRKFTSLTDLRDEFILYLPSTFDFDNVHGRSRDEEASDDNDGGEDESQSLVADIMQERVIQFQQSIVAISEEKDGAVTEEEESVDDDVVVVDDTAGTASNSTLISDDVSTTDEYAKLMIAFKAILYVTSGADILSKVLPAASCLEGKDTVSGAVSFERKSKSLLGRWIGKAADSGLGKDALVSNNQVVIERDTIILVNSKFGTGARAATLSCHFRVVNIYEKYYNKWFMSKHPFKKWKCEAKPYKLEVRMVNKDVLDEYTDEELCGDSHYVDDEICKIVEDRYILNVVGKLEQHGVLP